MATKNRLGGFVYRNKQAFIGFCIGIIINLIFHLTGPGAFSVGAFLTGIGVLFDYLDGGDRDV